MFGVPIDLFSNFFCDNKSLYKNITTPESVPKKKYHYLTYHIHREALASKDIRVAKKVTENNISDILNNIIIPARRRLLLDKFNY